MPTAAVLLLSSGAAAATLRGAPTLHHGSSVAPHAALAKKKTQRRCGRGADLSLIAHADPSHLGRADGVFMDGYSRVSCDVDIAPDAEKVYFADHACGENVKTCRLTELGMSPQICFDFCRQYENAKFFGLQGQKCYCSRYFHPKSVGGQGVCDFHCEGAEKEMCGGKEKASLFEMHMCANSAEEAAVAKEMEETSSAECASVVEAGKETTQKLRDLGDAWKLGVCSVDPEGQRACALNQAWVDFAAGINDATQSTGHASDVLAKRGTELADAQAAVEAAGEAVNADQASAMELGTIALRDAAASADGEAKAARLALKTLAGPIGGAPLAGFADHKVFAPLGDVENGWNAVCALVPISGQAYAATAADDPAACANHCLTLSTGKQMCVAFNYQYRDGLAACQFLTSEGIVEPKDILSKAVPVFEVSNTKRDAMGIASMGCFASGAFMGGHATGGGTGKLATHVVREVTA